MMDVFRGCDKKRKDFLSLAARGTLTLGHFLAVFLWLIEVLCGIDPRVVLAARRLQIAFRR
jgi:hypothetical protein